MNVIERILARVVVDANGCHIFQGALDRGYGRIGPWRAEITAHGHRVYLGVFPTREAATGARREAELRLYGEALQGADHG